MIRISDRFQLKVGRPLTKYKIKSNSKAETFKVYDHDDLNFDLNSFSEEKDDKSIVTDSKVVIVKKGDLVFSSVTGKCAVVSNENDGKALTQNFIRIRTLGKYKIEFLAYLLNESQNIKRQYNQILQTSLIKRYDKKSVENLKIPEPSLEKQELISKLYFKELRKYFFEISKIKDERKIVLSLLEKQTDIN